MEEAYRERDGHKKRVQNFGWNALRKETNLKT